MFARRGCDDTFLTHLSSELQSACIHPSPGERQRGPYSQSSFVAGEVQVQRAKLSDFRLLAQGSFTGRELPPLPQHPTLQLPITLLLNTQEPALNQGLGQAPTPPWQKILTVKKLGKQETRSTGVFMINHAARGKIQLFTGGRWWGMFLPSSPGLGEPRFTGQGAKS